MSNKYKEIGEYIKDYEELINHDYEGFTEINKKEFDDLIKQIDDSFFSKRTWGKCPCTGNVGILEIFPYWVYGNTTSLLKFIRITRAAIEDNVYRDENGQRITYFITESKDEPQMKRVVSLHKDDPSSDLIKKMFKDQGIEVTFLDVDFENE